MKRGQSNFLAKPVNQYYIIYYRKLHKRCTTVEKGNYIPINISTLQGDPPYFVVGLIEQSLDQKEFTMCTFIDIRSEWILKMLFKLVL